MKKAYPVILSKCSNGEYFVRVPDFDSETQGKDIVEAIEMARDLIGLMAIHAEDKGREVPEPYTVAFSNDGDDLVTLVDVDFIDYRKKVNNKAVKKNCTIPYWMSVEADRAKVNYSKLLQEAIANQLGLNYNINN